MKKIILNADDFGPCEEINKAIYDGIKAGLVSSVSAFVTFGEKNYDNIIALKKYIDENGFNVGIGLHFTINAGKPVNQSSNRTLSFAESGLFAEIDDFKWRINLDEFENEMKAQINKLAELIGGKENIDHINSHVGICQMRKKFWKIMVQQNLPVRSPDKFVTYHKKDYSGPSYSAIEKEAFRRFFNRDLFQDNIFQKIKYIIGYNVGKKKRHNRFKYAVKHNIQIPNLTFYEYFKQGDDDLLKNVVDVLYQDKYNDNKVVEIILHLSTTDHPKGNYNGIHPRSFIGRTNELEQLLKSDLLNYMNSKEIGLVSYKGI